MVLPVNVDSTYADSGTDASVALHQQHHDTVHGAVNALAGGTAGQVLSKTSGADFATGWADPVQPGAGPASSGLLAWNWDPIINVAATTFTPASGYIYLGRVDIPRSITVNTIRIGIATAGSALGNCYLGLYDTAGNRLGVSAAQTTAFQSTGVKAVSLTSGVAITGGPTVCVYVAMLCTTGTLPLFAAVNQAALGQLPNGAASAPPYRMNFYNSAGQTSLPATLTPATIIAAGNTVWAGLS